MEDIKEIITGFEAETKSAVDNLKSVQATGAKAIAELNAARAAGDEGRIAELSEKIDKIGADIKSARAKIDDLTEKKSWFEEYTEETKHDANKNAKGEFLESLVAKSTVANYSVGEHFANLLHARGVKSAASIHDLRATTSLTYRLSNDANISDIVTADAKDIKSIYSNNGVALMDGGNPVPGHVGFQCGLVEDPNIACLLDPPADDWEECLTISTLNGNRLRFTREVARDNNAAAVLETVYNPYPIFAQDGTKPEGSFTLASVEVGVSKIAEYITISDEALEDCSSIASHIDHVLISDVDAEKRRQLITGTGLNGEMRGIINQPDVLTRTHRDTGDGGAADDNIYDTLRRSLTDLWLSGASTDNVCVILNPRDGELIDLAKDGMDRYLFNDSECFNRQLRCLRIRYSADMPSGTAVIGNFANNWIFYVRKALTISMGLTGDQFITNSQTIRGEMRGAAVLRCPSKVLKVTGLA